jgi:hypothetical protein
MRPAPVCLLTRFDEEWTVDLDYNLAFHLRSETTFAPGQRAVLHALHQWLTYGGWLEGKPWAEWNDRIIAGSLCRAEQYCAHGAKPVLIPPERRPYLRELAENERNREYFHHDPEWLPVVTCVGVFQGSPARDQSKPIGILTVVWYQAEYAPPIAEPAAQQLSRLDWTALATDIEI